MAGFFHSTKYTRTQLNENPSGRVVAPSGRRPPLSWATKSSTPGYKRTFMRLYSTPSTLAVSWWPTAEVAFCSWSAVGASMDSKRTRGKSSGLTICNENALQINLFVLFIINLLGLLLIKKNNNNIIY